MKRVGTMYKLFFVGCCFWIFLLLVSRLYPTSPIARCTTHIYNILLLSHSLFVTLSCRRASGWLLTSKKTRLDHEHGISSISFRLHRIHALHFTSYHLPHCRCRRVSYFFNLFHIKLLCLMSRARKICAIQFHYSHIHKQSSSPLLFFTSRSNNSFLQMQFHVICNMFMHFNVSVENF